MSGPELLTQLQAILSQHDDDVAWELASEGERADLWTEVDIPVALLREAVAALSTAPQPAPAVGEWQPIESAPELDRVLVAGWEAATRTCVGYWWMHEDVIVNGKPDERPDALLWHPFPDRPPLSSPAALSTPEA